MGTRWAVGIDIGGTKTMVGVFDRSLELKAQCKFRTHAAGDAKGFVQ